MILIDFEIDENELLENFEEELEKLSTTFFVTTIFIMPIRILVNGYDLVEYNGYPWAEMPIMHLASNGLLTVKRLKKIKKEVYNLPEGAGEITLTMIDDKDVRVAYKGFAKPVVTVVSYEELLEAFKTFADKVRKFLWERVPQMNTHHSWGPWLRGERD